MSANFVTLNTSKTEFLLIGLKQQLAKINSCSLDTVHSARNLGFIFDERLTFFDQIYALFKSCYSHIRQLRCISKVIDHRCFFSFVLLFSSFLFDSCDRLS